MARKDGKKSGKGKSQVAYVTITIQALKKKQIVEQKEKVDSEGIVEVRTHTKKGSMTSNDVKYNWKTTEYRIPLFKLGLTKDASKSDILTVLNNPSRVVNKAIADVLKKLVNSFGGVKPMSFSDKYHFKTERFKKKKDYTPKKKVMMG